METFFPKNVALPTHPLSTPPSHPLYILLKNFCLPENILRGPHKGRWPNFLSSPSTHPPTRYRLARPNSNTLFVTGIFQNADSELSLTIQINFAIKGGSKYFSDLFRPQFSEYSLIFNTLHNSTIPGPPLGKLARLS